MQEITFYIGEENGIVKEQDHFEESIFTEQYKHALTIIESLLNSPSDDNPNIFAFCGDRGEGKTSCMSSVLEIIANKEKNKDFIDSVLNESELQKTNIEVLDMIDPAFFDNKRNILEHVLGQLYIKFREFINGTKEGKEQRRNQTNQYQEIIQLFQKAKECLRQLDDEEARLYDPLEELSVFASGIKLHETLCKLFKSYLSIKGLINGNDGQAGRIMVCIDDIDLNIVGAYRMVEQIRKYLNNKYCLIAISINTDQLISVIGNSIQREMKFQKKDYSHNMSVKYVTKLIPLHNRITMPNVYDISNARLNIYSNRTERELLFSTEKLKLGVPRLIYQKVRFLFYNSKGGISAIVPNNLRSLRHLLGLLTSMDNSISQANKKRFKDYFFKVWTKQLAPSDQQFSERVVEIDDVGEINKYVVGYLSQCFASDKRDELETAILNSTNCRYNISVGDVLYLIEKLELRSNDRFLKKFLFFIQSFYSIKLYELYDDITEKEQWASYFPNFDTEASAYRSDLWFGRTNELQRFVSGNYFTYTPRDFLAPGKYGARDLKVINGKILNSLVREIRQAITRQEYLQSPQIQEKFRLLEFFVLTISRSIYVKDEDKYANFDRTNTLPEHLTNFNESMGMFVFDIMYPFTAILNLKFAYERFSTLPKFFEIALENEWSLLRQMIRKVRIWRCKSDDPDFDEAHMSPFDMKNKDIYIHYLMSNGILRNTDIICSLKEKALAQRQTARSSSDSKLLIREFYQGLRNSRMQTYNKSKNTGPYIIVFSFLDAIIEFLENYDGAEFYLIFNGQMTENISDRDVSSIFSNILGRRWRQISGKKAIEYISEEPNLYSTFPAEGWESIIDIKHIYTHATLLNALRSAAAYIMSSQENRK